MFYIFVDILVIAGNDRKDCIKRISNKLHNDVQLRLNRMAANGKTSLEYLDSIIHQSIRINFPDARDCENGEVHIVSLENARDRHGGFQKRKCAKFSTSEGNHIVISILVMNT
jgi:hypothetical protein